MDYLFYDDSYQEEIIFDLQESAHLERVYYLASGSGREALDSDNESNNGGGLTSPNWNIFGG